MVLMACSSSILAGACAGVEIDKTTAASFTSSQAYHSCWAAGSSGCGQDVLLTIKEM